MLGVELSADGLYLIEVDRVLRPGGYWILSGPPIRWKKYWRGWERSQEDLKQEQDSIEDVAKRLCWKKVIEKGDLAIWQKPINHIECIKSRSVTKTPHICKADNPDTAWYSSSPSFPLLIRNPICCFQMVTCSWITF